MGEPNERCEITINCPKCSSMDPEFKKNCPACSGTGKVTLHKLAKQRKHDNQVRNWQDELKKRGLWHPGIN